MSSGAQQHKENPCFDHFSSLEKIKNVFDFATAPLRILDLGCGDGRLSGELVKKGHEVWGIDSSTEALQGAKNKGLQTISGDLEERLPFVDEEFDLVLALDVLEHLGPQEKILREINRILKKEGRLIIAYPNHFDLRNRLNMLWGGGIIHWDHRQYKNAKAWQYGHIRFLLHTELKELLDITGFYPEKTQFNFMSGGLIPSRITPKSFRIWLLRTWPQLFTGKYILCAAKEKTKEKFIYIPRTVRGM